MTVFTVMSAVKVFLFRGLNAFYGVALRRSYAEADVCADARVDNSKNIIVVLQRTSALNESSAFRIHKLHDLAIEDRIVI